MQQRRPLGELQQIPNRSVSSNSANLRQGYEVKKASVRHIAVTLGKENASLVGGLVDPTRSQGKACFSLDFIKRRDAPPNGTLKGVSAGERPVRTYVKPKELKPFFANTVECGGVQIHLDSKSRTFKRPSSKRDTSRTQTLDRPSTTNQQSGTQTLPLSRPYQNVPYHNVPYHNVPYLNVPFHNGRTVASSQIGARTFPRNPSYLAAIEARTQSSYDVYQLRNGFANSCIDRSRTPPISTSQNGHHSMPLRSENKTRHKRTESRDASTTTDDLCSDSGSIDFRPNGVDQSWKRMNILQLLGSDCDKELSTLCLLHRDGHCNCSMNIDASLPDSPLPMETFDFTENFTTDRKLFYSEKFTETPVCKALSPGCAHHHPLSRPQPQGCQSPTGQHNHQDIPVQSLCSTFVPNFDGVDPNVDWFPREESIRTRRVGFNPHIEAFSFEEETGEENVSQFSQESCCLFNECQDEGCLPLPHRLSLKLNSGMGVEISHGSSRNEKPNQTKFTLGNIQSSLPGCQSTQSSNQIDRETKEQTGNVKNGRLNDWLANSNYERPLQSELDCAISHRVRKWVGIESSQESIAEHCFDRFSNGFRRERAISHDSVPKTVYSESPIQNDTPHSFLTDESANDFSQICIVDVRGQEELFKNEAEMQSTQVWLASPSSSSGMSVNSSVWNFPDVGAEQKTIVRISSQGRNVSSPTRNGPCGLEDPNDWSLEVQPSVSFVDKSVLGRSKYKGYYTEMTGREITIDAEPLHKPPKPKRTLQRWRYGSLQREEKGNTSLYHSCDCLCDYCVDLCLKLNRVGLDDEDHVSIEEKKTTFSNPAYREVPSSAAVTRRSSTFLRRSNSDVGKSYAAVAAPPVPQLHSTPEKPPTPFWVPCIPDDDDNGEMDGDDDDLSRYFADGAGSISSEEYQGENGNDHAPATVPRLFKSSDDGVVESFECRCEDCRQQREQSLRDPTLDGRRLGRKYKAKEILVGKAQLKLSLYMNCGLLTIHVIKAKKVTSERYPACNPYVKVSLYPERSPRSAFRSTIIQESRNPVFDQKFSFELMDDDDVQRILVSLWHRDIYEEKSEFLGCMSFGIRHIMDERIEGWYRLLTEDCGRRKHFAVRDSTSSTHLSNKGRTETNTATSVGIAVARMEDSLNTTQKNFTPYLSKKDFIDKKLNNSPAAHEAKSIGKTPFTVSVTIPRGSKGFGFSVTWVQPVRVARVVADSPADLAGLKVGDRIIFIGQENIVKASDKVILKLIKNERNVLQLEVYRRGLGSNAGSTGRDLRNHLEGGTDSPSSSSRLSHYSCWTDKDDTPSTPSTVRMGRVPSSRTELNRNSFSWSRLNHEGHSPSDLTRRQAIYQLVTCEENFANLTYFGLERYVHPLRNKVGILSSTEHIVLFQNIEELVWLSEGFVERIMEGELNSVGNSIGAIYQEKILELCGAYQFYCNGIHAADTLLTSKMLNPNFIQFLQDPPIPKERLDITSFIHRPVEHFREVLLLLQTILVHTETRHADYDPLENVVETMKLYYKDITSTLDLLEPRVGSTSACATNTTSCAVASGTTMEDLEQHLVFTKSAKPFKLCEPGRQWVFGSELQKHDGKNLKACWVMLFTDMLVFTRVGRDKVLFVIEDPIPVTTISRAYFNIKKKSTEFRLIVERARDNQGTLLSGLQKRHRTIILRAESVELKTMWQSYIQRQVWLLRGHEQNNTTSGTIGTPNATKKSQQTGTYITDNNQQQNGSQNAKKITGTFVLGKKKQGKETALGRILPSSSGKRQFLLEFLEGHSRIGKGDLEPLDWDYDNDPIANLKGEELAKLRQQMLSRKIPNYFEGEYEEFFFDDDDDEKKSSRGSEVVTQSPTPTIRSNLSTPQRKHKVSPGLKPKKLSFKLPNNEIKKELGTKPDDASKADGVSEKDSIESPALKPREMKVVKSSPKLKERMETIIKTLSHGSIGDTDAGSGQLSDKSVQSPSLKPKEMKMLESSPKLKEKVKAVMDILSIGQKDKSESKEKSLTDSPFLKKKEIDSVKIGANIKERTPEHLANLLSKTDALDLTTKLYMSTPAVKRREVDAVKSSPTLKEKLSLIDNKLQSFKEKGDSGSRSSLLEKVSLTDNKQHLTKEITDSGSSRENSLSEKAPLSEKSFPDTKAQAIKELVDKNSKENSLHDKVSLHETKPLSSKETNDTNKIREKILHDKMTFFENKMVSSEKFNILDNKHFLLKQSVDSSSREKICPDSPIPKHKELDKYKDVDPIRSSPLVKAKMSVIPGLSRVHIDRIDSGSRDFPVIESPLMKHKDYSSVKSSPQRQKTDNAIVDIVQKVNINDRASYDVEKTTTCESPLLKHKEFSSSKSCSEQEERVEGITHEQKANSETSSGYQSEKASNDSPALKPRENRIEKTSPARGDRSSGKASSDPKPTKASSGKDRMEIDVSSQIVKPDKSSPITQAEKIAKESPATKPKQAKVTKTSPNKDEKVSTPSEVHKAEIDSVIEKGVKETQLLKVEPKSLKPSPDKKEKTSPAATIATQVKKTDAKSATSISKPTSGSPATKAANKGKEIAKKDEKKPDAAKKAGSVSEPKVPKTTDASKIKSSEKAKKDEKAKGSDSPATKAAVKKPASEKSPSEKAKKDVITTQPGKSKEPAKKAGPDKSNGEKSKDKKEKLPSSSENSKSDTVKKAPSTVADKAKGKKEVGVPDGKGDKKSADKSGAEIGKDSDQSEGKTSRKTSADQSQNESGEDVISKTEEHVQKTSTEKIKGEKFRSRRESESVPPKPFADSPHLADFKNRIRSRIECRSSEGRRREGSPRLKKMCNDNREFYFDADIEIDYPELVGTPRMARRDKGTNGVLRRCGSIASSRRCGSFADIRGMVNQQADIEGLLKQHVAKRLGQRKDSYNSHSEQDRSTPSAPESRPGAVQMKMDAQSAKTDGNEGEGTEDEACPPGSGHCGENAGEYLSQRRDSYSSHTEREPQPRRPEPKPPGTGKHRSRNMPVKAEVHPIPSKKGDGRCSPGGSVCDTELELAQALCVIHNHEKNKVGRDSPVYAIHNHERTKVDREKPVCAIHNHDKRMDHDSPICMIHNHEWMKAERDSPICVIHNHERTRKDSESPICVIHNYEWAKTESPMCAIHNHGYSEMDLLNQSGELVSKFAGKQQEWETSEGGDCVENSDIRVGFNGYGALNGDELEHLGSSLDDMLKCEVWLMNQCDSVKMPSTDKSLHEKESLSSTLCQNSGASDSQMAESGVGKNQNGGNGEEAVAVSVGLSNSTDSCSPAPNETPKPAETSVLSSGWKTVGGFVAQQRAILEARGIAKFLAKKIASWNRNSAGNSSKSDSTGGETVKALDIDGLSKPLSTEADSKTTSKSQIETEPTPKVQNTENQHSLSNNRDTKNQNSDTPKKDKVDSVNLKNGESHTSANSDSSKEKSKRNGELEKSLDSSIKSPKPSSNVDRWNSRLNEINYMASTSKCGPTLIEDCCMPPHVGTANGEPPMTYSANGPLNKLKNELLADGVDNKAEGVMTPRRRSNIKMGTSRLGERVASPVAKSPPLNQDVNSHPPELPDDQSMRRMSTGSLAKLDEEKKGRFSIFKRSASPSKVREPSKERATKVAPVKDNKEIKTEAIKGGWFPWRSPWRKNLHDCASLPATPPTHTPTLSPRDLSTSPPFTGRGSENDLRSWFDDE